MTAGSARASLTPVMDAAPGRLGPRARLALVAEVLADYAAALPTLRSNDLALMVARARHGRARAEPPGDPRLEHRLALRLGNATQRTLAPLPSDNRCLVRSLVLLRMLSRRSIPALLVIGVRAEPGFQAHAWVEHRGLPVLPDGDYARLLEI